MKKLLVILMILTACSEDEPDTDKGCQTGISKQTGQRELIRCCTQQQALAGDNVQAGGTISRITPITSGRHVMTVNKKAPPRQGAFNGFQSLYLCIVQTYDYKTTKGFILFK
jgi:hypothetical protein